MPKDRLSKDFKTKTKREQGLASNLPSPTVITAPAKIADLIWLSELVGVRPLFQGAFEVNKVYNSVSF
jgi:hypothetical protein